MPNKHTMTRASAVVKATCDGCLGDEGKCALEVVVRNVMAERHSAEKIAEVVDCTTSLSLTSVTALSRADDTLEVGDAALLPSGSAVKRRQQWLDGGSLHAGGASRSQVVTPSITSSIGWTTAAFFNMRTMPSGSIVVSEMPSPR